MAGDGETFETNSEQKRSGDRLAENIPQGREGLNDLRNAFKETKSISEPDSGFPPPVFLVENSLEKRSPLVGGIRTDIIDTAPDTPQKGGTTFEDRLNNFARSRFATTTIDRNAIQLAPDWENSYKGTCYLFQTDANDFTSQHKISKNQYGQIVGESYRLANDIRPINLPLPEEVIPPNPGNSINIQGQLRVQGTQNDYAPYRCTIERTEDGGITISGEYERPATSDQIKAGIPINPQTGMAVIRFGRHYRPDHQYDNPNNMPESPYEADPNSGF